MAHRISSVAFAAALLASFGCTLSPPELTGRACPCIEGWTCDVAENVCVKDGAGPPRDSGLPDGGGGHDAAGEDSGPSCGDCDDEIACTRDLCLIDGECAHVPDSSLCNGGETCDAGVGCKPSTCVPPDCDDHDECTGDTCDVDTSLCSHEPLCPGRLCCAGAICADCCDASDCEDSDPCTTDACTANGCTNTALADGAACGPGVACCAGQCAECCDDGDCDDGSACTADDCAAGQCNNTSVCGCEDDGDCQGAFCCAGECRTCCDDGDCDDGDACTLDSCESGRCMLRETCPGELCCGGTCGECCDEGDCDSPGDCEGLPECLGASCEYPTLADGAACSWGVCCGGACDECCVDEDCPPPDWECYYHGCIEDTGDHWCQDIPVPNGTACFWEEGSCCAGTCCPADGACLNDECIVVPDELESEPNDDAANANPLSDGSRLGAQIEPSDDQDWYVITLAAGETLEIDTSEACGMDTVVFVYADPPPDPAPTELTCDQGNPAPALACVDDTDDGYCAELSFDAPADGRYFIRVVTYGAEDAGPYLISVWIP